MSFSKLLRLCVGGSGSESREADEGPRRKVTSKSAAPTPGEGTSNSSTGDKRSNLHMAVSPSVGSPAGAVQFKVSAEWRVAIEAMLEEIAAGSTTKIPSFEWRFRRNFGTGATVLGPEGARRLATALMERNEAKRAMITETVARLSSQEGGNGRAAGAAGNMDPGSSGQFLYTNSINNESATNRKAQTTSASTVTFYPSPVSSSMNDFEMANVPTGAAFEAVAALEAAAAHTITALELKGQAVGDGGAAAIGDLLASDQVIETIILSLNDITATGAIALARGLQQNRGALRKLVLLDNPIDSRGVVAICRAIRMQQLQQGKGLQGDSSSASGGRMNTAAGTATSAASGECGITSVELGVGDGPMLDDDAVMALRDACFSSVSRVSNMRLANAPNAFTAASLGAALRGLNQNRHMTHLSLHSCVNAASLQGLSGARPLVEPLATCVLARPDSPLRALEIAAMPIGDLGARLIADALRIPSASASLRILALTKCAIGFSGFEALGSMLETNQSIHRLDLGGSYLAPEGDKKGGSSAEPVAAHHQLVVDPVLPLARAMRTNTTLQELLINDLKVSAAAVQVFVDALSQPPNTSAHNTTTASSYNYGRNGGGMQAPAGPSACVLRSVRHGGCLAVDALVTRFTNLLAKNEEHFMKVQKELLERQDEQARAEALKMPIVSATTGFGAVPLSSSGRSVVTFSSVPSVVAPASSGAAGPGSAHSSSYPVFHYASTRSRSRPAASPSTSSPPPTLSQQQQRSQSPRASHKGAAPRNQDTTLDGVEIRFVES